MQCAFFLGNRCIGKRLLLDSDALYARSSQAAMQYWESCAEPPVLLQSSQASSQSLEFATASRSGRRLDTILAWVLSKICALSAL